MPSQAVPDLALWPPFELDRWQANPPGLELHRDDRRHVLQAKTMQVLCVLHEAAGRTVSKDALSARVWGMQGASDELIARHVSTLRRLLEDDPRAPRLIKTVPRVGYRLEPDVERAADSRTAGFRSHPSWRWILLLAVLPVVFGVFVLLAGDPPPGAGATERLPTLFRGDLTVSDVGDRVAFVEGLTPWRGGDLVVMTPGQPQERRILGGDVRFPSFAPDGSRLAFYRFDGRFACELVVWRLDGWRREWSAPCVDVPVSPAAWQSTARLIEAAYRPADAETVLRERGQDGIRNLVTSSAFLSFPRRLADGRLIALRDRDGQEDLVEVGDDGTLRSLLALDDLVPRWLAVDGTGSRAVLVSRPGYGATELVEIDLSEPTVIALRDVRDVAIQSAAFDGGNGGLLFMALRLVGRSPSIIDRPGGGLRDRRMLKRQTPLTRISPDATQVAFLADDDGVQQLRLASIDGGPARTLATLAPEQQIVLPAWSEDGDRLVFAVGEAGSATVVVYDLEAVDRVRELVLNFMPADVQLVRAPLAAFVYEQRWGTLIVHRIDLMSGTVTPVREVVGAWARVSPDGERVYVIDSDLVGVGEVPWEHSGLGHDIVDEPIAR